MPSSIVEDALRSGDLICLNVDSAASELPTTKIIQQVEDILKCEGEGTLKPVRICIPSFGSPQWRDVNSQVAVKDIWLTNHLQFTSNYRKYYDSYILFEDCSVNIRTHALLYYCLLISALIHGEDLAGFRS